MSGLVNLSASTKAYQGVEVLKNYATGTQVAKYVDGTKNVVLGSGNSLSKLFGEDNHISFDLHNYSEDQKLSISESDNRIVLYKPEIIKGKILGPNHKIYSPYKALKLDESQP